MNLLFRKIFGVPSNYDNPCYSADKNYFECKQTPDISGLIGFAHTIHNLLDVKSQDACAAMDNVNAMASNRCATD